MLLSRQRGEHQEQRKHSGANQGHFLPLSTGRLDAIPECGVYAKPAGEKSQLRSTPQPRDGRRPRSVISIYYFYRGRGFFMFARAYAITAMAAAFSRSSAGTTLSRVSAALWW